MKYLLFLYPCNDTWDSENSNKLVAEEMSKIVTSDEIKFVYGDNHSVFHFESDMSQPELTIYVNLIKEDVDDFMFLLVQGAKSVTTNMADDHFEHLMKVNKKGRKPTVNHRVTGLLDRQKKVEKVEDLKIKFAYTIEDYLKNQVCDLTIDEILDKITEQGIESLTNAEKDKLDQYSKEL